ncbi:hypothetical protein BGX21_006096 [Mortierella sp. AD011]|nr:hypothetical protein BGX21_006096 [Mortierella sp. AD011]
MVVDPEEERIMVHQIMTTEELLEAVVDKDVDDDESGDNGYENDKQEYEKPLQRQEKMDALKLVLKLVDRFLREMYLEMQ